MHPGNVLAQVAKDIAAEADAAALAPGRVL